MPRSVSPPTFRDPRHQLGLAGEEAAIRWFQRRGWTLEAHRFRLGHNDLDLVIRKGSLVAFVEVKTRGGTGFGAGREAIGWRKRRTLARVAEVWRLRHGRPEDSYRFDVVEVQEVHGGPALVTHLEDAWRL